MIEGTDYVVCALCGHKGKDLTKHLKEHNLSTKEYKEKYGKKVVASVVEEKRKQTCESIHGDPDYKNREAIALSNEIFDGGHSLRDPAVREKAADTMEEKYGERHFTNRKKAMKTTRERYGVDYTCQVPEVIEKRVATLKERYGRVFNIDGPPHNKKDIPGDFEEKYRSRLTINQLALRYGVSEPVVDRWIKKLGLSRAPIITEREMMSAVQVVGKYLSVCSEKGEALSFSGYGKIVGDKHNGKLKRLFNAGKRFSHLKQDLFKAVTDSAVRERVLAEVSK